MGGSETAQSQIALVDSQGQKPGGTPESVSRDSTVTQTFLRRC